MKLYIIKNMKKVKITVLKTMLNEDLARDWRLEVGGWRLEVGGLLSELLNF